jgi:hypothetical protein
MSPSEHFLDLEQLCLPATSHSAMTIHPDRIAHQVPVSLLIQLFEPASASAASALPPTAAANEAKNSPASFFAVESIRRPPSCASLPPIYASTS